MTESPSMDQIKLVAKHGSSPLMRALAIVELADKQGRLDELRELVEGEND